MFFSNTYNVLLLFCILAVGLGYRKDYTFYSEADGWFKVHRIPANWNDARLRCHLEGAVLASPTDHNIMNALLSAIWASQINSIGIFSGIHATFSPGDYFTIEGVPLSSLPIKWAPNEPDNHEGEENCLLFFANGTMGDVKCTNVYPYICYKKKIDIVLNECGTIDKEYNMDTRTGNCYKLHRKGQTWTRAYMTCVAEGGYLSVVNSDLEMQILTDIFARYPDNTILSKHTSTAYIGFHDWGEHGTWRTVNGQTLTEAGYERFGAGQPDNATTGEFCGSMWRSGAINDHWCAATVAFFCEKSPNSLLEDK